MAVTLGLIMYSSMQGGAVRGPQRCPPIFRGIPRQRASLALVETCNLITAFQTQLLLEKGGEDGKTVAASCGHPDRPASAVAIPERCGKNLSLRTRSQRILMYSVLPLAWSIGFLRQPVFTQQACSDRPHGRAEIVILRRSSRRSGQSIGERNDGGSFM